jgi:hypothetical protein
MNICYRSLSFAAPQLEQRRRSGRKEEVLDMDPNKKSLVYP